MSLSAKFDQLDLQRAKRLARESPYDGGMGFWTDRDSERDREFDRHHHIARIVIARLWMEPEFTRIMTDIEQDRRREIVLKVRDILEYMGTK